MSASIRFYPGDTVRIGSGRVLHDVASAAHQVHASDGEVAVWSHNTGRFRDVGTERLTLIARGKQGLAADAAEDV